MRKPRRTNGFTLVEIAVVLAIVGVLLGGLVVGLGQASETQKLKDTRASLALVQEALLAYAAINGRLPCPDTNADGLENAGCTGATVGAAPWATLGLSQRDAGDTWGGTAATAVFNYRADNTFVQASVANPPDTATGLQVRNLAATTTYTAANPDAAAAVVYSAGKNLTLDGDNVAGDANYTWDSPTDTFDDELIWVSKYLVLNRMVQAGKWPP
jgi:prepilin-type N-terminal cleavage/methylation domain-containing protein